MKKLKTNSISLGASVGMSGKYGGYVGDYLFDNRVPVLYPDGTPAMPTKASRAFKFLRNKKATKYRNELGIFCIKLIEWPKTQEHQTIVVGVDPGRSYTGIAVQSSRYTLLGLHVTLPVEEKKASKKAKKGGRIRSDIKANRECENFLCKFLMTVYPISNIVLEVSKTKKPKTEWNPTLVGQDWQFKRLQGLADSKSVDGVQTAYYRKYLGIYKQKKRKGENRPETQVVDGIALAASGFLDTKHKKIKIRCRLTPGPFMVLSKTKSDRCQRNICGLYANSITQIDYPEVLKIRTRDNGKLVSKEDEEDLCAVWC